MNVQIKSEHDNNDDSSNTFQRSTVDLPEVNLNIEFKQEDELIIEETQWLPATLEDEQKQYFMLFEQNNDVDIRSEHSLNQENEKKAQCIECGKIISASNKHNLVRHYKLVHNKEIVFAKNRQFTEQFPKKPNISVKINMDKNTFLKCCVGLVTVKNMPLRIFDDREFFKTLISPYEETCNTNLNSKKIVNVLECSTTKIIDIIKNRVKNRMISLKIDIATRMDLCILFVNIQYIDNSTICINTLGMIKFDKKHKATYLKDQVLNCLKTYGIEISQIYSSTTDYGSNVIKFGKILQELQIEEIEENYVPEENDNIYDNIQRSLMSVLSVERCAADTIQLAAYDVIKSLQTPIAVCRKTVKIIRNLIRTSGVCKELPFLDNTTRWTSIFEMIKSLLNLKDFIDSQFHDTVNSLSVNWDFVSEFVASFTPLSKFTKLLQKEQYILGDFYRDWLSCEIELEDIASTTASRLHQAMQNRKKLLLENDAFLAALYLDPRLNFINSTIISEQQKYQALEHLVKTFEVMRELENLNGNWELTENISNYELEENVEKPTISNSAYAKLTQRIMSSTANTSKRAKIKQTFREKLLNLSTTKMVSLDTNILEYFKAAPLDADVLKVMDVALAVPASHVSVERAFSALALTLTNLRNKLSNITLNNLLITKLNFSEIKPCGINLDEQN